MRSVAFTAAFGAGAAIFCFRLLSVDWETEGVRLIPASIAAALFLLYALGGPFARGFPGVAGAKMTLFLCATATAQLCLLTAAIATRSSQEQLSDSLIAAGALSAALTWVTWNVVSWLGRLRGATEETEPARRANSPIRMHRLRLPP